MSSSNDTNFTQQFRQNQGDGRRNANTGQTSSHDLTRQLWQSSNRAEQVDNTDRTLAAGYALYGIYNAGAVPQSNNFESTSEGPARPQAKVSDLMRQVQGNPRALEAWRTRVESERRWHSLHIELPEGATSQQRDQRTQQSMEIYERVTQDVHRDYNLGF